MEWNIPNENAIITRLDELYEALDRFPDSPMAPAWQHEIERLKEQLTYAGLQNAPVLSGIRGEGDLMKAKLNDAQARAYIAGEQSEPVQEIERKHILHLAACLREAADRPGMNLAALCKTAEHYVQNHQRTENRQELALLIAVRDAIKARSNAK